MWFWDILGNVIGYGLMLLALLWAIAWIGKLVLKALPYFLTFVLCGAVVAAVFGLVIAFAHVSDPTYGMSETKCKDAGGRYEQGVCYWK